VYAD